MKMIENRIKISYSLALYSRYKELNVFMLHVFEKKFFRQI
jgi:hypothetical protein